MVRYRVKKMHQQFLEKESVATQAQIFELFVSIQEVEGSLVIIGYSKEDKIFKGEAKCVRKYIQCNKND